MMDRTTQATAGATTATKTLDQVCRIFRNTLKAFHPTGPMAASVSTQRSRIDGRR